MKCVKCESTADMEWVKSGATMSVPCYHCWNCGYEVPDSMQSPRSLRGGEEIADEHWAWMRDFITDWSATWAKLIEKNYKEGFIHGYKHGKEETEDKVVCDLWNKVKDLEEKVKR